MSAPSGSFAEEGYEHIPDEETPSAFRIQAPLDSPRAFYLPGDLEILRRASCCWVNQGHGLLLTRKSSAC
jgi:hypothetical protein